jgi:hypothetical protein
MIKTQNLTKHYDGLVAVEDLSFSVEPAIYRRARRATRR